MKRGRKSSNNTFTENGKKIWKCGKYKRLSKEDGHDVSYSIENQDAILDYYLANHPEIQVVDNYQDDGRTGTDSDREDFQRLLADIYAKKINCVIVKDLSRLSRNDYECGHYLEYVFVSLDVRFISVELPALDSYLREEVEGEVGSLLANFVGTALLVTHNRDEAYRLCREMIVMDSGEVLRAGTTKEVFADPRTRAAARLTGCKNILPCTRVGEHTVHLAGWEQPLTVALPVPEGCRAVGIRAHDFAPCAPGTPNSLPVQAVSTSENPFDWNMIFTLPGGEARLWWKVSKETLAAPPPKAPACLAAAPENIMPLV